MERIISELNDRTVLKASFRKNKFSFMMVVDRSLSISDECLFYCVRCIEQCTENVMGYSIDFEFKTSQDIEDLYEQRAMKICRVCKVLEIMNPGLFDHLQEKLQNGMRTKTSVCDALSRMQMLLFQNGITWAKIVALFAFTGALVVECVLRGNSEFVVNILYSVKIFVENEVIAWIKDNQGWAGMLRCFDSLDVTPQQEDKPTGFLQTIKASVRDSFVEKTRQILCQKTSKIGL